MEKRKTSVGKLTEASSTSVDRREPFCHPHTWSRL